MTRTSLYRLFLCSKAVILVLLVGATYQGVATALERRQFPRPGHMVNVGGHQLHIHCLGEGSPTVVLEAPALGMSEAWAWVAPAVARETRVCAYDRAGLGWSERGDRSFDPMSVPRDLQALLERAGERGPFVVTGHGLGAAFATMFALRFGDDTAALVLIDQPTSAVAPDRPRLVGLSPWLARFGVLRVTRRLSRLVAGLPEPSAGALRAFLNRPDHLTVAATELSRFGDVTGAASAPLRSSLRVTRIEIVGTQRTAFLAGESQAAPATAAILDAVTAVRRSRVR